ncbi:MAG TPA: DUF2795 domain-containing protein [Egibacteraceae bacterium]|nr:DUF2795 domain-containing protein [Egibacteraceae bacterium]
MASVRVRDLRQALEAVDYPAGKDQLLARAEHHCAGEDVLRALRSLPPVRYRDLEEVVRSVDVELGPGPPPQQADPGRKPGADRVAERLR